MDLRSHKPRCKQKPINVLHAKRNNLKKEEIGTMKATVDKTQVDPGREAAKQKLVLELRQRWPNKTGLWLQSQAEAELRRRENQSA
jgi:hypothetical protein